MIINGKKRFSRWNECTRHVKRTQLDVEKVVVEVNASIIEKTMFSDHKLSSGDKIEIIAFVGGG